MAMKLGAKEAHRLKKGKVLLEENEIAQDLSVQDELLDPEASDVRHIFQVPWNDVERVLCSIYLGYPYRTNYDVTHQDAHQIDTHYDKTKLCLFVIHHLLGKCVATSSILHCGLPTDDHFVTGSGLECARGSHAHASSN